jgi:hypothetical protein
MCFPWRPKSNKSVQFGDSAYLQFDGANLKRWWVTAPAKNPKGALWKFIRIANANPDAVAPVPFARFMALRHPTQKISKIVPKIEIRRPLHHRRFALATQYDEKKKASQKQPSFSVVFQSCNSFRMWTKRLKPN